MSPRASYQRRIVALVCAVLGICASARGQSALDGFDPGANNTVKTIVVQPDGKILLGGDFTMLGGGGTGTTVRNRIGRLNADGSLDATFNPGANGAVTTLVLQPDGRILVGGNFTGLGGATGTTTRNNIGRLNADGSVDAAFNPGTTGFTGVYAMIVQPDAKILVSGVFTGIGGGTGTTPRSSLARLNADGSVDTGFNPGVVGDPGFYVAQVYAMALQPDGKIVVGGRFKGLGGGTGATPRESIGRLNSDGSVDLGFNPGTNSFVSAFALQPDGKIVVAGTFYMLGGGGTGTTPRNGIGRLNANGTLDTGFNPGTDNDAIWSALALQPDGKILLGGAFNAMGGGTGTTPRHHLGRINADGSLDLTFNPGANGSFNDYVYAFAVQPDGKVLVGGTFTGLGGGTGTTTRNYVGRLYADGSVEVDFNPGATVNVVYALAVQPDQKILVGGDFTGLGGGTGTTPRSNLGRLNADGSLDTLFNPGANGPVNAMALQPDGKILVGGGFGIIGGQEEIYFARLNADGSVDTSVTAWMNGPVWAVAVQPDGKILVGGEFSTMYDGDSVQLTRNRIARLNADGSFDTSFNPGVAGAAVYTLAVQTDGKILVGGNFTGLGGGTGTTPRSNLGRLNADGSLDTLFNPGANSYVHTFSLQPDGKIVVGGIFIGLGGGTGTTTRNRIGRLNADGTLDTLFNPGANINVYSTALQADGKILVAGYFTALGGGTGTATLRSKIGRIFPDGTIDPAFDPGANNTIFAMALQGDGKMLFGGYFTTLGGGGIGTTTRNKIGRVSNPDAALQRLSVGGGGTIVTWTRGGAAPDPARVTFEASLDAVAYTPLGSATRMAGGWQLGGLSLPTNQNLFVRARGFYGSGYSNGSGSMVESIRNAFALPCTFALSSSSALVPSGVNSGGVALTTSDPGCSWTAPNSAFITVTSNSAGMGTTFVTWVTSINPGTSARMGTLTIAGLPFTITQAGASTTRRVDVDFNHDALSDIAVFRPGLARWFISGQPATDWGAAGDMPVPGDYNNDGAVDIAVFRPSNGTWYVNGVMTVVWGMPGDIPVPGDYNGDYTTDMAVFRPGTGQWLVRNVGTFAWGLAGDLPVPADYNGDGMTDIAVYRPSTGTWYVRNLITAVYGFAADIPVPADYDGNGTADIAVFRPATGTWFIKDQYTAAWGAAGDVPMPLDRSGDGVAELGVFRRATGMWYFKNHVTDSSESLVWGGTGDIPLGRALPPVRTPWGDYDGDRKADLTVFHPSTGDWVSLRSLSGQTDYSLRSWGLSSDVPVGRDYDGDGKIDPTVFRPSTGRWLVLQSSTNYASYVYQDWGLSTDTPVPADYDGDGKADFAVYRPSLGRWVILLSSTSNTAYAQYDWGVSTDIVVPADYDGDGVTDLAVFRPSTGRWYILNRMTGATTTRDWGLSGDIPVAADFDGDGKADVAVFRPSLGRWFITSSIDGSYQAVDWGLSGDYVVPADYDADGKADVAVFRPSTGTWYVRGLFNRSWGLSGDIPVLKNP